MLTSNELLSLGMAFKCVNIPGEKTQGRNVCLLWFVIMWSSVGKAASLPWSQDQTRDFGGMEIEAASLSEHMYD